MPDKQGSSSYSTGDTGGSCGDYHGVSDKWLNKRIARGVKKSSPARVNKFINKMSDSASRTREGWNPKGKFSFGARGHAKYRDAASMGRKAQDAKFRARKKK